MLPTPQRTVHGYDYDDVAQAQIRTGEALAHVAGKIDEHTERENEFDYARAQSHMLRASMAAEAELEADPDYSTYEQRYLEKMQKAMGEASQIIQSPLMREKFEIQASLDRDRGAFSMKGKARAKEVDFARGTTDDLLDANKEAYLQAIGRGDEKTATAILKNSQSAINGAVNKNYYSREEAAGKRRGYVDSVLEDRVYMLPDTEKVKLFTPTKVYNPVEVMAPAAEKNGIDPDYLYKTASLETGGTFDPSSRNPVTGAAGLMQFMPGTAKQYKLDDPHDPVAAIDAAARLAADNKKTMLSKLGREPSNAELYLAHQQGAAGAAALLSSPTSSALEVLTRVYDDADIAQEAIINNGGSTNMTAGEFASLWTSKYDAVSAPQDAQIPYYKSENNWTDLVPARKKKEAYEAGLRGLEGSRKLEEQAFQQDVNNYLVTVLPKIEAAGGDWSKLSPEEQREGDRLGMLQRLRGYDGRDNTEIMARLYRLSPEDFATAIDTPEVMLGLSQATWKSFKEEQRKAAAPGGGKLTRTRQQLVTDSFEALGLDPGGEGKGRKVEQANQDFARFNILLDGEIAAYRAAHNNAEPDDQTLQGMVDKLLIPQAIGKAKRNGRQEVYLHQIKIDDIPARDRAAVERNLMRAGKPVSNGAIIRRWLQWNESVGRIAQEEAQFDNLINNLTGAPAGG